MQLLSVFLLSLSANIDSFTVGITYGIKDIKVEYKSNILIALITSLGTYISMYFGIFAKKFIQVETLGAIGCLILVFMGLHIIINAFKDNKHKKTNNTYTEILIKPQKADTDNSGTIDIKEAITLGSALSLNNFGLGVGASAAGLNVNLTTIVTFILSIVCIKMGVAFGKKYLSKSLENYADLISGIIIIFLGLYELIS